MSTISLNRYRVRQERWRHHSAAEREALNDLAVAINRYLAQASPKNINNAAFMDAALPHLEKYKQVLATAKRKRLSQLRRTLELTAQSADPNEKAYWEVFASLALMSWVNATGKANSEPAR